MVKGHGEMQRWRLQPWGSGFGTAYGMAIAEHMLRVALDNAIGCGLVAVGWGVSSMLPNASRTCCYERELQSKAG